LGAKLVLDLVEGLLQFAAVVAYVDDAAAGVVGELIHVDDAVIEGITHVIGAVGDEDHIDDGVGFLCGFGGGLEGFLRALVAAVGEKDDDLASSFDTKLVMRGEVDGVEEQRTAGIACRKWAAADAGDAGAGAGRVDRCLVDGALQFAGVVGVVGEQVDVDVERDEECFVFWGENVAEERSAGFLLQRQNGLLAAAGVQQNTDGEREIFFLRKVFDGLLFGIFKDAAVIFAEAGDVAVFVADGEIDVDKVDLDVQGLGTGGALLLGGSGALRRRAVG